MNVDRLVEQARELANEAAHNARHYDAGVLAGLADAVEQLQDELEAAQLRSIEARNPGIDIEQVARERRAGRVPSTGQETT